MTVVELCNNALAEITHDRAITSLTDGSAEAVRCALFWPRARRSVLSAHPWSFLCTSAAVTAAPQGTTILTGYTVAYSVPTGALTVNGVTDASGVQLPFVTRAGIIHVAGTGANVHYTVDSETPDNWPAAIQDAVIADLAGRLAKVMSGSKTVIESCMITAAQAVKDAIDADSRLPSPTQASSDAVLDLCNNALAAAGNTRDIASMTDGSREAALCTRLYPLARRAVFAAHPWSFLATEAAPGTAGTAITGYTHAYAAPAAAIAVTGVTDASANPVAFTVRGSTVHTKAAATKVQYTADSATPSNWPPAVKDAIIAELSARLTRVLPASKDAISASAQIAERALVTAIDTDKRLTGVTQDDTDLTVDLFNNALAAAGHDRDITSLTDGSREASLCVRLYPLARRSVFAAHPWSFLAAEAAPGTAGAGITGFTASYAAPASAVNVTGVTDSSAAPLAFTVRGATVYVNGTPTKIQYTSDDETASHWPPAVKDAIIAELAARLSRVLPSTKDAISASAQIAADALQTAIETDKRLTGVTQTASTALLDLYNVALAAAGHDRDITSLTDGSREAGLCARLYPLARRAVLSAHPWEFVATSAAPGTGTTATLSSQGYTTAYPMPTGAISVNGATDSAGAQLVFIVRASVVHVKGAPALLHYTADSESPADWPPAVKDAIIAELAARIARDLPGSKDAVANTTTLAERALAQAVDADKRRYSPTKDTSDAVLDLCNNALAAAGHDRDIGSLTDGSREASLCMRAYPLARRAVFAAYPWDFLAAEAAPGTPGTQITGYTNAYAAPAACISVTGATDSTGAQLPFTVRGSTIHTKGTATKVQYTTDSTTPADWPPAVKDAVIAELAARLARTIPTSKESYAAAVQNAALALQAAIDTAKRLNGVTQDDSDILIDLFNSALAGAGSDRDISSLADGSREAILCARHIHRARRAVFAAHPWTFLATEAAPGTITTPDTGYTHAYAAPAVYISVNGVTDSSGNPVAFTVRGSTIHTKAAATKVQYTADSETPANWPPAVKDAVIAELSFRLARSLPSNEQAVERAARAASEALQSALAADRRLAGLTQDDTDTVLDFCNNALASIGHPRDLLSLADGSREAQLCTRLYPLARRAVLSSRPWAFAALQASPGTSQTAAYGYALGYLAPTGAISVNGCTDALGNPLPFIVRGGVVYTNSAPTYVQYTADDDTPSDWPPAFKDAVIAELAARLARALPAPADTINIAVAAAADALKAAAAAENRLPSPTQADAVSVLDLCNNALAAAGHDRDLLSLTDGSREAALCTRLYPLARRAVLASHPWTFATVTEPAYLLEEAEPLPGRTHVYAAPPDALAIRQLISEDGNPVGYIVREGLIHADGETDSIAYTIDVPDPTQWPPAVQEAVIAELAARLSRALPTLRQAAPDAGRAALEASARARRADANLDRIPGSPNRYIAARA